MLNKMREQMVNGYQIYQGIRALANPYDLERILKLSETSLRFASPDDAQRAAEAVRWSEDGLAAVKDHYRMKWPTVDALEAMPPGSFGAAVAAFLRTHGIDPANLRTPDVVDDLTYLAAHLTETHDLWHVITGFPPTLTGEAGLAAFGVAQTGSPLQVAICAGALLNGLSDDRWGQGARLAAIAHGWEQGTAAAPLVGMRWDHYWETPLEALRSKLKIVANVEKA